MVTLYEVVVTSALGRLLFVIWAWHNNASNMAIMRVNTFMSLVFKLV